MPKNSFDSSEREFLLRLYENSFRDEATHIQFENKTLTLFSSLVLAVTGGVLLIIKDPNIDFTLSILALLIGGLLEIVFSFLAIQAFQSNYRRHLESIAFRAKLEDLLDFGKEKYRGKNFWTDETLMHIRHIKDRKDYSNSSKFVSDRINKGFALIVKRVFSVMLLIGIIFILLALYRLVEHYCLC